MIPFNRLFPADPGRRAALEVAAKRVLRSGDYILGGEGRAFEREFATAVGAAYAVGCASGLDALILALDALGVGPGDDVLVPTNTYVATWLAVTRVGATPVGVEPDPATHLVTPEAVAAAITPRTRAVIPVHLYGRACDIGALRAVCDRAGLWLVDDAAQAHGAWWGAGRVGTGAHATAWSFYPTKNLGALGDAGAVTTDDAALADRIAVRRNYGFRERYCATVPGYNSRLDELQAALLRVKLTWLADDNQRRAAIADHYLRALGSRFPVAAERPPHVWHLFVVRARERDIARSRLDSRGIQSLVHYPVPPHRQPVYATAFAGTSFPVAEWLADHVVSLPCHPGLRDDEVERIAAAIAELGLEP